jgi:hypothetical protein
VLGFSADRIGIGIGMVIDHETMAYCRYSAKWPHPARCACLRKDSTGKISGR